MVNLYLLIAIIILSFGIGGLLLKMSVARLGPETALFWTVLVYIITDTAIFLYLLHYGVSTSFNSTKILPMLAGLATFSGVIWTYWLFNKMNASIASPLTALYPAVTVVLAVLILKEKIKLVNGVGILLALAAAVLLAL